MTDVRHIVVSGHYENIPIIADFVASTAQVAGFGDDGIFHCQMAVDEACTNVIEHAYGGEGIGDIEVTCTITSDAYKIQVIDHGKPFDPEIVPAPKTDAGIEELKPGGIGLHLMRQVMDDVSFEFGQGRNVLTMTKQLTPHSTEISHGMFSKRQHDSTITIIIPDGRLGSTVAVEFEKILLESITDEAIWLIVDFKSVTYISSKGLTALMKAWRRARDSGGDVFLYALTPSVWEVFDTVGFTQVLEIFDDLDACIDAIDSRKS